MIKQKSENVVILHKSISHRFDDDDVGIFLNNKNEIKMNGRVCLFKGEVVEFPSSSFRREVCTTFEEEKSQGTRSFKISQAFREGQCEEKVQGTCTFEVS